MTFQPKLVRDKIPEIMRARGREPIIRVADPSEYRGLLLAKLAEESAEVVAADDQDLAEELSDVLEVVLALAADLGISADQLENVRAAKEHERGGFAGRIVWCGCASEGAADR